MKLQTKHKANKILTGIAIAALVVMASLAAAGANKVIIDISNSVQTTKEMYEAPSLHEYRVESILEAIIKNQRVIMNRQLQQLEQR